MRDSQPPSSEEVDHLLRNGQLRDELEPYFDESMHLLDLSRLPTPRENEFLASMLAWERAPVLPISQWFEPDLTPPHPDSLDDSQLHEMLWALIHRLYAARIVLDFTDHLSDRQLYCLIYRDILPATEKKIDLPRNYLHWHCLDDNEEPETWLQYYASPQERKAWSEEVLQVPPPSEPPPYPRKMPRRPQ